MMGEVDANRLGDREIGGEGRYCEADRVGVFTDLFEKGCRVSGGMLERPCFPSCDDNGASVGEEVRRLSFGEALPVDPPVAEEESFDFPGLDAYDSSLFVADKDCTGAIGLGGDSFFCPPLTGECMEAVWIDEKVESLLHSRPMLNQLFSSPTGQGLSLHYAGMQEDQSEVDACAVSGETSSSLQGVVEGQRCLTSKLEAEVGGGSVQGSPDEVASFSAVEGLAPEPSSSLTTAVDNCSSNFSSDSGNGTSTCCKTMVVSRRSNPKRAASLRSSLADNRKPDKSTGTKNVASRCTNATDIKASILSRIANRATRKISYARRAAPVWGAVEKLVNTFEEDGVLARHGGKESFGSGKQKRQAAPRGRSSRVSETEGAASSDFLNLKDQRSQHPLSCGVVGIQASVTLTPANFKTESHVGNGKTTSEVQYNLGVQTCGARVKSLQDDGLHRDKDLESTLTQDTYVENMLGECPVVAFRSGTGVLVETVDDNPLLDPGTSPDSDIYHPIINISTVASGLATPTNQDAERAQCTLVTKSMAQFGLHADFSTDSAAFVTLGSVSPLDMRPHTNQKKWKKGKKKGEVNGCLCPLSEHISREHEFSGLKNLSKATKISNYSKPERNQQECFNERSPVCSESIGKTTGNGSNCNNFRVKSSLPGETDLECYGNLRKVVVGSENRALYWQDVETADSEPGALGGSLLTDETKSHKFPKAGLKKGRSSFPDSARHKRRNSHAQMNESLCKSGSKGKTKEKNGTHDACTEASGGMGFSSGIASDELQLKESCHVLEGQSLRPRAAWVSCDDCYKWRCIPTELADIIGETDCKWTCKDNKDNAFADCSIPQEKTNAEINVELELSDASCGEDSSHAQLSFKAIEPPKPAGSMPASWMSIKSNLFLHRNRKTQTIDEIMVCHCKPPSDGSLGCGEECLNRMLNIECVRGTCPCGDLCSNQQFQKRKYAKLKSFRCGKKGQGLQLEENVSHGQFLIEYVGEVLDFTAYEARQRCYASLGQKHFYFMTLNGGEVIDACSKGNLGRFINHSCDPNCRTEKWMVNGEVCIGLFATRDIKKGEEVTFNYQFVRVFGAAAKKCFCGAVECRGYIGDDPSDAEAIVQGDSDEEYPEPVMIRGHGERDVVDGTVSPAIDAKIVKHKKMHIQSVGGERDLDIEATLSDSIDVKVVEHKAIAIHFVHGERDLDMCDTVSDGIDANIVKHEEIFIQKKQSNICPPTLPEIEDTSFRPLSDAYPLGIPMQTLDPIPIEHTMSRAISDAENSSHSSNSIQTEETMCRPTSDAQPLEVSPGTSSILNESITASVLLNEKSIANSVEDKLNTSKPYPRIKSSRSKVSIKKARPSAKSLAPHKGKRMTTSNINGHFEGVEEQLNGLLDEEGGISKHKDATKGYLKLLFCTAAERDNIRGFASQSTRDLSLILDALLKTKSRAVLVDIIREKDGLQMLHKIMKLNQSNFHRIPIIRKLLKVLEFLAVNEILTPELINRSPPYREMESFKDSILILTRHNDVQVHQIARNFLDKWIPRTNRRIEQSGREDSQLDAQHPHYGRYQPASYKCRDQGNRDPDAIPRSSCEADMPGGASLLPSEQVSTSVPLTNYITTSGTRKRKTRWDNPSDVTSPDPQSLRSIEDQTVESGSKFMKPTSEQLEHTSQLEVIKQKSKTHKEDSSSCDDSMQQSVDDEAPPGFGYEVPPGFGSPRKDHHPRILSEASVVAGEVVMASLQQTYLPHLSVSYGMPAGLMQHLGTPEADGGNRCYPCLAAAPGIPFIPYPPLPQYPRGPRSRSPTSSDHNLMTQRSKDEIQPAIPSISGERPAHVETGTMSYRIRERVRSPPFHGPERRFSGPLRWGNRSFDERWPPWPRERDNCGNKGRTRNGASSSNCIGNTKVFNSDGFCFPEGVSSGDISTNFRRQSHHN